MFKPFVALLAAPLLLGNAPLAYVLDASASSVSAKVPFFGLSSKTATFPEMTGAVSITPDQPDAALIDVTIDARALTAPDTATLNRLRGEKFFWVEKYPSVRFVGTRLTMTGAKSGKVDGKLTARGVTRSETLAVTFDTPPTSAAAGQAVTLNGTMTIDRRNYGMKSYQLIVGKQVTIRLKARMVPN
ncbi:YceI family protein [Erythrobacter sp. W53]|uniref:YceI family protein n=1 Tax=Erythrobacter sp. W53 TaxID=3425947 RepID=UPI003D767D21